MASPSSPFSYLTRAQAVSALLLRLNSTGSDFWTLAECQLYLAEALRVWNCLTATWVQDFTATYTSASAAWQSLANSQNSLLGTNSISPRYQTLTDSYVYTVAQYHLLEQPTGNGTWTGTPQFTLADFTQAFQRCRDYILQQTACNVGPFSATFTLPAGSSRVYLPDNVLDPRRVRFIPAAGQGSPSTIYRDDGLAFEYFEPGFTTSNAVPMSWDVLAGPELALTFDTPAPVPNSLDMLAVLSGGTVTPPTASALLIPDDWYWVLKFGMMADLLRKDSESTDLERADYCSKRFEEGVQLMIQMPWLLQARINNIPVDTPSVMEMDDFAYEWQSNTGAQAAIVRGGIDLFAISPKPVANVGVTLSLVGNAPIPATDAAFVQLPRDVLDVILDEAQHLAMFKCGGFEFAESSRTLHANFLKAAVATNKRLRESGIFATTLRPSSNRLSMLDPRFALEPQSQKE